MEMLKLGFCFLLLGVLGYSEGRVIDGPGHHVIPESRNVIPVRCIDKSVTNVTCFNVSDDSLLPHPDDCQLFYYCVGQTPVCRECPAGLHFNPSKHVCDKPQDAGCGRTPTSAPEDTSTSTTPATSPTTTKDPLTTYVTLQ